MEKGRTSPSLWLAGHDHMPTIARLSTADQRLERAILDFIERPL
jgi:hypothetical protein